MMKISRATTSPIGTIRAFRVTVTPGWNYSRYASYEDGNWGVSGIHVPTAVRRPVSLLDTARNKLLLPSGDKNVAIVEHRGNRLWLQRDGKLYSEPVKYRSFEWVGEGPAHDICGYCGQDNGPNGESRNGWDCCYCGGN